MKKRKLPLRWSRSAILAVSFLLILTAAVGGTLAYLVAAADPVTTVFAPAQVSCTVQETAAGFTVTNTGDTDVYVRVAVISNWTKNGSVYALVPITAADYTVEAAGWIMRDRYYYCTRILAPGETSEPIFVLPVTDAPDGCLFTAEILAQAIQSEPVFASIAAWGFSVEQ